MCEDLLATMLRVHENDIIHVFELHCHARVNNGIKSRCIFSIHNFEVCTDCTLPDRPLPVCTIGLGPTARPGVGPAGRHGIRRHCCIANNEV